VCLLILLHGVLAGDARDNRKEGQSSGLRCRFSIGTSPAAGGLPSVTAWRAGWCYEVPEQGFEARDESGERPISGGSGGLHCNLESYWIQLAVGDGQ
jgi:hypothetical protein